MKKSYLPFVIIVIVLVAAVGLAVVMVRKHKSGAADAGSGTKPGPNQQVLIEEYGDYQCPPCGMIYPELKKVESDYGDRVHIVFHHYPITKMHKNALAAAHAAEAARLQGKFWEMHDRLYRNQKAWAEEDNPVPIFTSYARELGLDADRFTRDMDSPQVKQVVEDDLQAATARGVTGTPTIYIEGRQMRSEAMTAEGLHRAIDVMLDQKRSS
jgi:protein-disulfide isomerase